MRHDNWRQDGSTPEDFQKGNMLDRISQRPGKQNAKLLRIARRERLNIWSLSKRRWIFATRGWSCGVPPSYRFWRRCVGQPRKGLLKESDLKDEAIGPGYLEADLAWLSSTKFHPLFKLWHQINLYIPSNFRPKFHTFDPIPKFHEVWLHPGNLTYQKWWVWKMYLLFKYGSSGYLCKISGH